MLSSNIVKEKRGTSAFKWHQTPPKGEDSSPEREMRIGEFTDLRASAMELGHGFRPPYNGVARISHGNRVPNPREWAPSG